MTVPTSKRKPLTSNALGAIVRTLSDAAMNDADDRAVRDALAWAIEERDRRAAARARRVADDKNETAARRREGWI